MAAHAKAILKIVVGKDEVREIGELPEGKYKWGGAIAGANGDVYCFPSDTERVLKVIPTPSHVLGRISPIFSPFFPVFCAFSPSHRGGSNGLQAGTRGQETAAKNG